VSTRRAWVLYILIRLGLFAAALAILLLLGINPWLSAIFAALIAFALSLIVLQRPRSEISGGIARWRQGTTVDPVVDADTLAEDAAVDAAAAPAAGRTSPPDLGERPGSPAEERQPGPRSEGEGDAEAQGVEQREEIGQPEDEDPLSR